MPKRLIYFVRGGEKLPLSEFLKQERESRKLSWRDFAVLCGTPHMSSYCHANSGGQPNNPSPPTLRKIIKLLGYSEQDFEQPPPASHAAPRGSREYNLALQKLGDTILEHTRRNQAENRPPQKLSTTAVKEFVSDQFYRTYGKGLESMRRLHKDLQSLASQYKTIELQHIDKSHRQQPRRLRVFEEESIETSLLEYLSGQTHVPTDRLPRGTLQFVVDRLNAELVERGESPRTATSLNYHVGRIWDNKTKRITMLRGSPSSRRSSARLKAKLQGLAIARHKEPAAHHLAERVVPEDELQRRYRRDFLRFASAGHNNLVLFLMDPVNYKKYLGDDLSLFAVDFPAGDINERMDAVFRSRRAELDEEVSALPDDSEVLRFVEAWLRCDMIFRRRAGGFVVVEVKQNASDPKGGFRNGTKACQQLSGYCAILLDNVLRYNLDHMADPDFEPLKESVQGYLAAYEIAPYFRRHLSRAGDRLPVVVPREEVDRYATKMGTQS